jgi:hypothetical protein
MREMLDRREGYQAITLKPGVTPFAEVSHEDAIAVAQAAVRERDTIARDRDRLAVENAALRERMAHLEHKPLPLVEWPREECVDHLAARRRAEGADMPPQADEPADLSWLGLLAVMVSAGGVLWFLWRML